MKQVDDTLNEYLNTEKHIESNDLFSLTLADGTEIYLCDADADVSWNDKTWQHNLFLVSRDQIKLEGAPSVDTLTVTIKCDSNDRINSTPFMTACHDGMLDDATLTLYKCYFQNGECLGAYKMFSGTTEVSSAGGLAVKLSVKSTVQGLSQNVPIRIFAPQSAYTADSTGTVVSSSSDTYTMLVPLKPSQAVLVRL